MQMQAIENPIPTEAFLPRFLSEARRKEGNFRPCSWYDRPETRIVALIREPREPFLLELMFTEGGGIGILSEATLRADYPPSVGLVLRCPLERLFCTEESRAGPTFSAAIEYYLERCEGWERTQVLRKISGGGTYEKLFQNITQAELSIHI